MICFFLGYSHIKIIAGGMTLKCEGQGLAQGDCRLLETKMKETSHNPLAFANVDKCPQMTVFCNLKKQQTKKTQTYWHVVGSVIKLKIKEVQGVSSLLQKDSQCHKEFFFLL